MKTLDRIRRYIDEVQQDEQWIEEHWELSDEAKGIVHLSKTLQIFLKSCDSNRVLIEIQ